MKKIELKHDMQIPGWGFIPAGTKFNVEKYNNRFVYVKVRERVILRLARKGDCNIVY